MSAVPEELRCKRSDGKQWRCSAASMPDKTVCEKHYVQAKKRSTSSALRASLRRSSCSATAVAAAGFPFPAASYVDAHPPMAVARPLYGRAAEELVYVAEPVPVPAQRVVYDGLPVGAAAGARTAAVSLVSLPFIEAALPSAMLVQNICTLVLMLIASGDNRS
jgi:[histone H3]-dimethyl-L-lysine9 demethylase